jgi:PAS domain S-box-containing protein
MTMDDDLRILVLGNGESPEDLIDYELSKSNRRFKTLRVTSLETFVHALQESSPDLILVSTGCADISSLTALALAQEVCPATPCFLIRPNSAQENAAAGQPDQIGEARRKFQSMHSSITSFFTAIGLTALACPETETLNTAKDAMQPLMQVAGVIIAFLSPGGDILAFNRGTERLTGWGRPEILGKPGLELFFPKADRTLAQEHLQRVMSGKSAESIDLALQGRNGATSVYRWYCNLVTDKLGQPAGIMLVGQPLTESQPGESRPRARLARCYAAPSVSRGRGLLTRRTGTC